MEKQKPQPERTIRDPLKAAILYLWSRAPYRQGQVKFQKMMFLADWLHFLRHGYTLTGTSFRMHHYGPYSERLREAQEELEIEGLLERVSYESEGSHKGSLHRIRHACKVSLSPEAKEILDEVIRLVGRLRPDQAMNLVYTLPPVVLARKGDLIEFERLKSPAGLRRFASEWEGFVKTVLPRGEEPTGALDPLYEETKPLRASVSASPD